MNAFIEYVSAALVVSGIAYLVVGAMLQDVAWPMAELVQILGGVK